MQREAGVVARRGLQRGRTTRTFTLRDLEAALLTPTTTVYVEVDAEGYVSGARGESAARVAACARPAPPALAAARPRIAAASALCLELTAGVAPHHDLTVWPPLHLLLLLPAVPLPLSLPLHSTDAGGVEEPRARGAGHECGYCGRRYSRRYGLRIHERTHTGARPLRCPHCARAFADPSNLNKHVRLHERDARRPARRRHADPTPTTPE